MRSGLVLARQSRDFTAKIEVQGLAEGKDYQFWFETGDGKRSPVGRFRTLPSGPLDRLTLAAACCQLYQGGFFNAMAAIARLERLDAVIHLGDYIYEYGADYPVPGGAVPERIPDPPHETVTLSDYRRRHAQCKRDPDLQAAHARAAFICVWDDHEMADNDWVQGAANHQPEGEGSWLARKAAALQAYFEWMPIREPRDPASPESIFRSFRFGDLASLFMLETRLFARSQPPAKWNSSANVTDLAAALEEIRSPGRELLGATQQQWLTNGLAASVRQGQTWQILGNQVIMAQVKGPDLEKRLGAAGFAKLVSGLAPPLQKAIRGRVRAFEAGIPFNPDSWDGYPAARQRLYQSFRDSGSVPLVLSGDSHAFWANNLAGSGGDLVARELGVSAVSSPGYGDVLPRLGLGPMLAAENADIFACDQSAKGFILIELTKSGLTADFMAVQTVKQRVPDVASAGSFEAEPHGPLRHRE